MVNAGLAGVLIGATIAGWSDAAWMVVTGYGIAYLTYLLEVRKRRWTPGQW